jgi:hypothetical protein
MTGVSEGTRLFNEMETALSFRICLASFGLFPGPPKTPSLMLPPYTVKDRHYVLTA